MLDKLQQATDPETATLLDFMPFLGSIGDPLSRQLFHYTTFDGLQGIIASRKLWATESGYLNDATEQTYSLQIVEKLLSTTVNEAGDSLKALLSGAMDYLEWLLNNRLRFITCFSECGDILSMWRGYAANGGGFSLRFDPPIERLGTSESQFIGNHMVLKVRYGSEAALDHDVVPALRKLLSSLGASEAGMQRAIGAIVAMYLDLVITRSKHLSFSEEREWRIVVSYYSAELIAPALHFRRGQMDVKPYLELAMPEEDDEDGAPATSILTPMPLSSITIGPTFRPRETERAVRWLLQKHGLSSVEVKFSKVPYQL